MHQSRYMDISLNLNYCQLSSPKEEEFLYFPIAKELAPKHATEVLQKTVQMTQLCRLALHTIYCLFYTGVYDDVGCVRHSMHQSSFTI